MNSMQELFEDTLKDTYNAEKQILKALPKMIKAAQNEQLKESMRRHEEQTREQCRRLEEAAKIMGTKPTGKVCVGMQGLIEEANEHLREGKPSPVMDAAIIICAQKVEHYEICAYGTMCEWARMMGMNEVLELLKQNMAEEEQTDQLLTQMAESDVNPKACQMPPMEDGKKKSSSSKSSSSKTTASKGKATMREKVSVK